MELIALHSNGGTLSQMRQQFVSPSTGSQRDAEPMNVIAIVLGTAPCNSGYAATLPVGRFAQICRIFGRKRL